MGVTWDRTVKICVGALALVLLLLLLCVWRCDGSIGSGRPGRSALSHSFSLFLRVLPVMASDGWMDEWMGLFLVSAGRASNVGEVPLRMYVRGLVILCSRFVLALASRREHDDPTTCSTTAAAVTKALHARTYVVSY